MVCLAVFHSLGQPESKRDRDECIDVPRHAVEDGEKCSNREDVSDRQSLTGGMSDIGDHTWPLTRSVNKRCVSDE